MAKASQQDLSVAIGLHRAGRLAEAERLYRQICAADRRNAPAFRLLGILAHQLGRPDAVAMIRHAVAIKPDFAEAYNDYGVILASSGQLADAAVQFGKAVAINPSFLDGRNNLGQALLRLGRAEEALEQLRHVAVKAPSPSTHFNLAVALGQCGRATEAVGQYQAALSLQPDFVEAHLNLATLLQTEGQVAAALMHGERAVALRPQSPGARNNLGNILRAAERLDDAISQYNVAVKLDPKFPMAYYNRGMALRGLSRITEAKSDFSRACELDPSFVEAELAACVAELPAIYADVSQLDDSRLRYRERLLRLAGKIDSAGVNAELASVVGSHQPFYLPYQGRDDRDLQVVYGNLVNKIMFARYPAVTLASAPAAGGKIRIGIVSGFFRQHSNWKTPIKGWLSQLDRARFEVFGYYTSDEADAETAAAAAMCARFVRGPLTLDAWRQTILDDAPHVMLYPEIGMDKVAAQLAAQRLARVQCCSWGHPVTSGFPTMDYFLSSDLMEPADAQRHYSERLVRLPNLSIFYERTDPAPAVVRRADQGLNPDAVVYWCGQSLPKYLPQFDDVFARIAKSVDNCQFAFVAFSGGQHVTDAFKARLDRAFTQAGVAPAGRYVMLPRLDPQAYVAAIGQCDVVLDSLEWSGCNSTLEGLPHDLPIVTMKGKLMRGRHGAAILAMMGLSETVAETLDDYVAIAIRLGRSKTDRLAAGQKIAAKKHRVYGDRQCIAALERFFEDAVAGTFPPQCS